MLFPCCRPLLSGQEVALQESVLEILRALLDPSSMTMKVPPSFILQHHPYPAMQMTNDGWAFVSGLGLLQPLARAPLMWLREEMQKESIPL